MRLCTLLLFGALACAPERERAITASRYEFSPSEIAIRAGEPTTITYRSADVRHSVWFPRLGIAAQLPPGKSVDVKLPALAAGTYEFQCATYCGRGHGHMRGTLHIR